MGRFRCLNIFYILPIFLHFRQQFRTQVLNGADTRMIAKAIVFKIAQLSRHTSPSGATYRRFLTIKFCSEIQINSSQLVNIQRQS